MAKKPLTPAQRDAQRDAQRGIQIRLEQQYWMELGSILGWRLQAHTYCQEATFLTSEFPCRVTIDMTGGQRDDILNAIRMEHAIRQGQRNAQRRRAGRARAKQGGLPRRLFVKKEK
jgi:hypothetical protein